MIELLPCPFCGYEASISEVESAGGNGRIIHIVGCNSEDCDVSFHGHARKVDAAKAWNTRQPAEPKDRDALIEAAESFVKGDVALEYLAEMAAAHGLANKPALDRDAVIEAAREFGRSYLVTRTGKDVLEKYVWIRWLMADFHIAQTQQAAQPAESEVCECGHLKTGHVVDSYCLGCNTCPQYRPATVLATQEGELLDRDIETAFAEVKRTTNLLGAWDYKDCPYAHEKMWKDGCKKGIEIAMQNTDLTAALSFEAGQRSERARIAKEIRNAVKSDKLSYSQRNEDTCQKLQKYITDLERGLSEGETR